MPSEESLFADGPSLLYKEETYAILGAAMEVYNELGAGFLESVYEAAFVEECKIREIPIQEQVRMNIGYKEIPLSTNFIADIVAYGKIIIELKAIKKIGAIEEAQLLNYLKATGMRLGLLLNFGAPQKLDWKRLIK
jgi:GxxExxY protein